MSLTSLSLCMSNIVTPKVILDEQNHKDENNRKDAIDSPQAQTLVHC